MPGIYKDPLSEKEYLGIGTLEFIQRDEPLVIYELSERGGFVLKKPFHKAMTK